MGALTWEESAALGALGREELEVFARLHNRCAEEEGKAHKLLSHIINVMAYMSFDELDRLILLYHQNYFAWGEQPADHEALREPPANPTLSELPENPKEPIYCPVCKIYLNGRTQYEDHLGGKKHRKKDAPDAAGPDPWEKWEPSSSTSSGRWVPKPGPR